MPSTCSSDSPFDYSVNIMYLKTDVLLLTDISENFSDSCVASYRLDLAYYCTLSDFMWGTMLKYTDIKFELLIDIDMVIKRGIRGLSLNR